MALKHVTDQSAVRQAVAEYELGQAEFLDKYGFGKARDYFLIHDGKVHDSKAIVGAAHGFQHGRPLRSGDFSGGANTVALRLRALGFDVRGPDSTAGATAR
jgi:5-methylcytosine-specific restriction protein A